MIDGVSYGKLQGFNQWDDGMTIDKMDDDYRWNIYNMIKNSCESLGVEIKFSELDFDSKEGWYMKKEWLEKYAYGFLKEIEQYFE